MIAALPPTELARLSCGMPVLMFANHEVAVATADIWVKTGAADEQPATQGISHFLEHMLFKGTAKWGLGEIERAIENAGGVCNAGTSHDFTHYYVTLPSAALATGIEMLAEMVRHSVLDPGELEKERLVILEEYRRKQDHPVGLLYERLYEELFESGPYHLPVIGTDATIRAITREAMADYYRRRYTPANMALVLTGEFDPAAALEQAEAAFAGFARPLETLLPEPPLATAAGKRIHLTKPTGGEVYVAFAFPAPGLVGGSAAAEQVLALDMAQFILGQGRAAVLYQNIKEKKGLCSSIGTYFPTHMRDSIFAVIATCTPDQRQPLREALGEELSRFAAEPPAEAAMTRARRLLASAHRFSMETSGGASSNIGYYFTMTGATDFHDRYLERILRIAPDEVSAAAEAVFHPDRLPQTIVEVSVGPA